MAAKEERPLGAIRLDQLVALNDEIGALVRAGVPLEEGLAELGRETPGRLGKLMNRLADDMRRGRPLGEALVDPALGVPPVYRAVVEAGLRADRLPAALESVAGSIRRLSAVHRSIALATIYPAIVICTAWVLFAVFAALIAPQIAAGAAYFGVSDRAYIERVASWGRSAGSWGPVLPLLVVVAWPIGLSLSRRAVTFDSRRGRGTHAWLPWLGAMLRWSRMAVFTDLLATLLEHRVPLHEAMQMAGEASGDPVTAEAAEKLAAALQRGESLGAKTAIAGGEALPPMVRWLIRSAPSHESLVASLRDAADSYRSRAQSQAELAKVLIPVVLTVAIGGTATLLYALTLFVPYVALLWRLV